MLTSRANAKFFVYILRKAGLFLLDSVPVRKKKTELQGIKTKFKTFQGFEEFRVTLALNGFDRMLSLRKEKGI